MQRIPTFAVLFALAACRAVELPRTDLGGVKDAKAWPCGLDIPGATSVAALDDLDGDGVRELAVGGAGNGVGAKGVVVVCPTSGRVHYEVWCPGHRGSVGCSFGHAVLTLGDVDGDGLRDFAVADPSWTPLDGNEPPYGVWIVSGMNGAFLQSAVEVTRATFGRLLAVTDDLDGDDIGDLLIGSSWMGANVIAAHSTRTGERLYLVHTPDDPRAITVTGDRDGDGTRDFITWLDGPKLISGATGAVVSDATWRDPENTSTVRLGDLDGDGVDELAELNALGCSVELRAQRDN